MLLKLIKYLIHLFNLTKVSACGVNTLISGRVTKRHPQGQVFFGNDCLIEGKLFMETNSSKILIGNNVFIGGSTVLDCVTSICVEDDVLISYHCILADSDNHSISYSIRREDLASWKHSEQNDWSKIICKPIKIGKGAWIGARSIILKGVTIGTGSVIGAGSVVTKDVPPWTIAAGNPARIIREIPENER